MKIILIRSKFTDSAVFKLAECLSKNGHDVTLLVWDRQNNYKNESKQRELYSIQRFKLNAPYDKWTAMFYLPLWWIYEFYFLLRHNADIYHACDLDTLWPAIIAKIIKRTKLFYTIYDFYANNLSEMKPYFLNILIRKFVSSLERGGIRFTEVLFLTDKNRYEEIDGSKIKKLVYTYNSPPDYFNKCKSYKSNSEFTIFYGGAITEQRGIEYMIKAVEGLDDVRLIIAGVDSYLNLEDMHFTEKTKNINYLGWIPYEDILQKTFESDMIFRFGDPKTLRAKYDSPNKLFEAMMFAKPIIVNSEMGVSKIVKKENCGLIVPYGDVGALKKAIIKLKTSSQFGKKLGLNGRKAYEIKYNWAIMEKRLLDAYKQAQ